MSGSTEWPDVAMAAVLAVFVLGILYLVVKAGRRG